MTHDIKQIAARLVAEVDDLDRHTYLPASLLRAALDLRALLTTDPLRRCQTAHQFEVQIHHNQPSL